MQKQKSMVILCLVLSFLIIFSLPVFSFPQNEEITEIIQKISPSVVRVEVRNYNRKIATGVVFDREGYIVTTALITPRDEKIYIVDTKGNRFEASLVGIDPQTHLALIKTDAELPAVPQGDSRQIYPGSWIGVVSISPENKPAVTQGIVSSIGDKRLRLNVWVVPGSSGSPVVNSNGEMIGLLRGIYYDDQPVVFKFKEKQIVGSGYVFSAAQAPASGMALAVPVEVVAKIASEIKEKGKVSRGWLGALIGETEKGEVEILEVDPDSPAEKGGLKKGDFVLQVNGHDVTGTKMFADFIREQKPGEVIELKIIRGEKELEVEIKLGEYTEESIWEEMERKFPRLFKIPDSIDPFSIEPRRGRWFWQDRKYIGIMLQELTAELSEYFGVKEGLGLLVAQIEEGSPAQEAGLKVGDVIIGADGERIESVNELSRVIQKKEEGDKIEIEFLRDRKKKKVEVKIAKEESSFMDGFPAFPESFKFYSRNLGEKVHQWKQSSFSEFQEKMKTLREELEQTSQDKITKLLEKQGEFKDKLDYLLRAYRGIRV